jgi:hypothetical protein
MGLRTQCLVVLAAVASIAGCGDNVQYTPIAAPTHDCGTASNVSIDTKGGTFSISGTCDNVRVRGSGNTVTIASAKSIQVEGQLNSVMLDAMGSASVYGSNNAVRYATRTAGTPNNTYITGDNNSVDRGASAR